MTRFRGNLPADTSGLRGKVALVCGGTRGLGADLAVSLAMCGCKVFATYRTDTEGAEQFVRVAAQFGEQISLLRGDCGDEKWCLEVRQAMLQHCDGLDILVLNACAPPSPMQIRPESLASFHSYIHDNLRLVSTPLATFGEMLIKRCGAVVGISSSFVTQPVIGFPHYIALKQAAEAIVQSFATESKDICALLVRPPRLLTSWNDTPTGILGAIGTEQVAVRMATHLNANWLPGKVDIVDDFPPLISQALLPASDEESLESDSTTKLVIASSFTADPILPGLTYWIKELGISARPVIAPYGQVTQELLNPQSLFGQNSGGVNVVLLRIADWLHELDAEKAASLEFLDEYLPTNVQELTEAVRSEERV